MQQQQQDAIAATAVTMAEMDIPSEEVLLGRCCECGIGLDPRTHPTMTCVNCLQARGHRRGRLPEWPIVSL